MFYGEMDVVRGTYVILDEVYAFGHKINKNRAKVTESGHIQITILVPVHGGEAGYVYEEMVRAYQDDGFALTKRAEGQRSIISSWRGRNVNTGQLVSICHTLNVTVPETLKGIEFVKVEVLST
jgi:hypothetical protein